MSQEPKGTTRAMSGGNSDSLWLDHVWFHDTKPGARRFDWTRLALLFMNNAAELWKAALAPSHSHRSDDKNQKKMISSVRSCPSPDPATYRTTIIGRARRFEEGGTRVRVCFSDGRRCGVFHRCQGSG